MLDINSNFNCFYVIHFSRSEECIGFTIIYIFYLFFVSMNIFSPRNPTPNFKCSTFSENVLDLVSAFNGLFYNFCYSSFNN